MDQTPRERFLSGYAGKQLLKTHSLDDTGLWHILGEDPNCDLGGHHHQPSLGYREGTLSDVIDEAVEMSRFWVWGAGGDIKEVRVQKAAPTEVEEVELTLSLRIRRPKDIPMEKFMEQMGVTVDTKLGNVTVENRTFTPK